MATSNRRGDPLNADRLFGTALRIVDSEGLEALSMRRLAKEVGVEAASLYHHIPNKDALIDGMIARVRTEVRLPSPMPEDLVDVFVAIFAEYRRVLAAHPNLVIYAGRQVESDPNPDGLHGLMQAGLSEDDAVGLWQSLLAFVVGFTLFGSQSVQADTRNQPGQLAARLADWRDETCDRTLRTIVGEYLRHLARG